MQWYLVDLLAVTEYEEKIQKFFIFCLVIQILRDTHSTLFQKKNSDSQ